MKLFKPTKHRADGDAARDRGQWAEACDAYARHLRDVPHDADILVQLGHCFKEQDRLAEAEESYRRALAVRPEDSETSLHLAHLLKRLGRVVESAEMFEVSYKTRPTVEAGKELRSLRGHFDAADFMDDEPDDVADASITFIEIDDLLGYLEAHKTLSGIQRVQVGVVQHVLSVHGRKENCAFVLNPIDSESLQKLRDEDLARLVNYVTSADVDHTQLRRLIAQLRGNAVLVKPHAGQCYLVLGAFWGSGGVAGRYLHLKRAGVLIGVYIYDLIPITHPEYCDARLSHEFSMSFADGMAIFDFVLTISDYTAREVIRYRDRHGLPKMPVVSVPLAHLHSDKPMQKKHVWGPHIAHLKERPFVLMVSTIEARKNHVYLVSAWRQMMADGLEPPDLVFVGRFGWHVSGLSETLELTHYLEGRVHVLHDLSDAELATLYEACLFTAFPSFVEGWGLPVGEGLAHGRPCVASSTSSVPEVAGDLVDYLDPHNLREGVEVLRKMAFDGKYRARRERDIAERFVPRTWRNVAEDLVRKVAVMKAEVKTSPDNAMFFPAGATFKVSDLAFGHSLPKDYGASPKRLMLAEFGYTMEPHGCWMRGAEGTIRFRTGLTPGTAISAYVQFLGAPWAGDGNTLSMSVGKTAGRTGKAAETRAAVLRANTWFVMRVPGTVDALGAVALNVKVSGNVPLEHDQPGARRFIVGIGAIGYAAREDVAARADIAEDFMFNNR